jgi:hypothetical protein
LPCSHIISDGVDSWLTVGKNGKLRIDNRPGIVPTAPGYYPYRYQKLAELTLRSNIVAAVLNRNGEILVFSKGNLVFAKRRGAWRYFDHSEVISALSTGGSAPVVNRQAVYQSCLDASFARCGAGCAIIPNADIGSPTFRKMVSPDGRCNPTTFVGFLRPG